MAFVAAVSMQGANAILTLEGLNTNQLTTVDSGGNHIHFDYTASNLNGELQYALYTPPVLPSNPQTSRDITEVRVAVVDAKGASYEVSTAVSAELDFWSYTNPAGTSTLL